MTNPVPDGYYRTAPAAEVAAARGQLITHGRVLGPPQPAEPAEDGTLPDGYYRTAPASEVADAIGQLAHRPAPSNTDNDND
ncbi:hypothetical protein GCM10010293_36820 [Streptomyces griseoflavus]|uniref:hypothetical protein n=1 Tax=Streptomyces griseoflavus TaxID=35619 RepID=UPI00167ECC12|nr:hypothetical protein [Streptomyces griseoflavus]GGV34362.1 hypothetical protein GCM10010293_36820 [Streptomyces griseoflavus]